MSETKELLAAASSEGHLFSEGNYLDSHFLAASKTYEAIVNSVAFKSGWQLLDAGAGGGSFIPLLSQAIGYQGSITAIDVDKDNVKMINARAKQNAFSCPVTAELASVDALPFEANSFDCVWSANVFQYLTDQQVIKTVSEFKRVVKPGGLVVVKDSDLSGVLVGSDPTLAWHFIEQACLNSNKDVSAWFKGMTRVPKLPETYSQADLNLLSYQTFIAEWRYPLNATEKPYLETLLNSMAALSTTFDLPEKDLVFWQRCAETNHSDYFLDSPDFYFREAFAVVVGQVPEG